MQYIIAHLDRVSFLINISLPRTNPTLAGEDFKAESFLAKKRSICGNGGFANGIFSMSTQGNRK